MKIIPDNINQIFGESYISDGSIVWVRRNNTVFKITVLDMRIYTNPDFWLVYGLGESNVVISDLQFPRDTFYTRNPKIEAYKKMILVTSKFLRKLFKIRKKLKIKSLLLCLNRKNVIQYYLLVYLISCFI